MVKGMVERGVAIDGVGLQGHLISGTMSQAAVNSIGLTMDYIIGLKEGMQTLITELDLRICGNSSNPTIQAQEYERIIEMALSKNNSPGLVFWGFTDKYSWIPQFFNGCDDALLFNRDYSIKPAYTAVLDGINAITTQAEQSPFNTLPFEVSTNGSTTVIPFREYDNGGSGIAYFDDTPGQETTGTFRTNENVDIAGTIVGFTEADEWMEYTINVAESGLYNITINTTSEFEGKAYFSVNGENISGTIDTPNTGSFSENYTDTTVTVPLEAGEQVLRFNIEQGPINLDDMTFSLDSLGVDDIDQQIAFELYPMPFQESFNISFEVIEQVDSFSITDLTGRTIFTQKHNTQSAAQLSPTGLQSGLYLLLVEFKNQKRQVFKIIKR